MICDDCTSTAGNKHHSTISDISVVFGTFVF